MNRRVNEIGLLIQAIVAMTRRPPPLRRIVLEVFSCGNRSIVFVCVTMAFFGMILVYEGCMQALALIPDLSSAGPATIRSTIRVFGPLMAGLMVSFRVGAGIAAEAGTMVVTEQDGALLVSGSSPAEWLVAPRLVACIIAVPALTVVGCLAGILAGGALGVGWFGIHPSDFFSLSMVDRGDAAVCAAKSLLNGMAIPVFAAAAGLNTRGGSEGVGVAATSAVVRSCVAVAVIEFLVSTVARVAGA